MFFKTSVAKRDNAWDNIPVKTAPEFKIYEKRRASGAVQFRVALPAVNGVRKQKNFGTLAAAEAYRNQCIAQQVNTRADVLQELNAATRHTVLAALELLRQHGATITEAVAFFLKHSRPSKGTITIQELIDLWLKVKRAAGMSEKYLTTANASFFTPCKDHFNNCNISDLTKEQCEKYIYGHKTWNRTTLATHLRHLTVLVNFAIEQKYATLNPFADIQKPKRTKSTAKERVMTVAGVQALMQYTLDKSNANNARVKQSKNPGSKKYFIDMKPELASMALVFFCGVRIEEVERIKWDDIKLDEEKPYVAIEEPKVVTHRRINPISTNAIDWLKLCRKDSGSVTPTNYATRMRTLRANYRKWVAKQKKASAFLNDVDYNYHQNSARICFASYHIAAHEDPSKTSLLLGHQSSVLLWNTYRALVTKAEAEKYWKIVPGKDVTIPTPIDRAAKGKRLASAVPAAAPAPVLALPAPVAAE